MIEPSKLSSMVNLERNINKNKKNYFPPLKDIKAAFNLFLVKIKQLIGVDKTEKNKRFQSISS